MFRMLKSSNKVLAAMSYR